MQKTVRELIEMIKNGSLHTEQSTQRGMIYADINVMDGGEDDNGHEITKSGAVLYSILQYGIKLPALYFWRNVDDSFDLIDGKQRLLSIYYFLEGADINNNAIEITTIYNGQKANVRELPQDKVELLNNYIFDIVVNEGSQEVKEITFDRMNRFAENLNVYERFRGLMYGNFITEFETYITNISNRFDSVLKPNVGRGEHIFKYLCLYFKMFDDIKFEDYRVYFRLLRKFKEVVNGQSIRNSMCTPDPIFEEKMNYFDKFSKLEFSALNSLILISESYRKNWNIRTIYGYFSNGRDVPGNDVKKWGIDTILIAAKNVVQGIRFDYTRFFSDDLKSNLYRNNGGRSAISQIICNYKDLEVDHITPWSRGGRTSLENAQLLTKSENAGKRDKYEV